MSRWVKNKEEVQVLKLGVGKGGFCLSRASLQELVSQPDGQLLYWMLRLWVGLLETEIVA